MINKSEYKKLFNRVQNLSVKFNHLKVKFDNITDEYYGYHYSDEDLSEIIDCIDYGHNIMTFDEFDKIMKNNNPEVNS